MLIVQILHKKAKLEYNKKLLRTAHGLQTM